MVSLDPETKHLTDTIKMLAYRAETALVGLLGPAYVRTEEEGRALVREVLRTPADILPDERSGVLRIRLHGLANRGVTRPSRTSVNSSTSLRSHILRRDSGCDSSRFCFNDSLTGQES